MTKTRNIFGLIGIVIALAGIGVAVFQDHLRPPPEPAVNLGEAALAKGKQWLGVESKEVKEEPASTIDWVTIAQFALGFLGIVLGAVSWVRKENHRISSLSAALGLIVVAWEYVLVAVGVAVLMLILGQFA